jgi:endonuclease/exonuclease/phosphatase family metal-dependent hydrolase
MRVLIAVLVSLAAIPAGAPASPPSPPVADGIPLEWDGVPPLAADPARDATGVDFGAVWARADSSRIYVRFEVEPETSLQGGNSIAIAIDGDGDGSTGALIEGVGAELVWRFGERAGVLHTGGASRRVEQAEVGLLQAPTVTATDFEISFARRCADGTPLAPGPGAAIVLFDAREGGDRVPDGSGALRLDLSSAPARRPLPVVLGRSGDGDIRVLTWNVLFDGLFKRPAPFLRVLRAIDPDVICFQELWAHTPQQTADQVSLALPGSTWRGGATDEGVIVSRFPFLDEGPIGGSGNYWAIIDLPDERYSVDLAVVSAHPPCCDDEAGRQRELDALAAWLRDARLGGAQGRALPAGTPIVVAGDMNLVGGRRQLSTLLAGEIADEATYGPASPPDWDGTPLADAVPRHAGGLDVFTWRDARSSFAPGRLDYVVYSDSALRLGNAFVLATEELTPEALARYGLHADDTVVASDHLPVVADFTPLGARSQTTEGE